MISVIHLNWTNEAHRSELLKAPTHLFHDRTNVCVEDGGVFLCIRIYLFYGTMCVWMNINTRWLCSMTLHSICWSVFLKNRCVFVHLMLCMKERDSEKERCCICFSLKGANERVFLLVEWGSWWGPALSQLSRLSQDKQGSSIPRHSSDSILAVPSLMMRVMPSGRHKCDCTWK